MGLPPCIPSLHDLLDELALKRVRSTVPRQTLTDEVWPIHQRLTSQSTQPPLHTPSQHLSLLSNTMTTPPAVSIPTQGHTMIPTVGPCRPRCRPRRPIKVDQTISTQHEVQARTMAAGRSVLAPRLHISRREGLHRLVPGKCTQREPLHQGQTWHLGACVRRHLACMLRTEDRGWARGISNTAYDTSRTRWTVLSSLSRVEG